MTPHISKHAFLKGESNKWMILISGILSFAYLLVIALVFPRGNLFLFLILLIGEIFHVWQAITYLYTVWDMTYEAPFVKNFYPRVDIFITVAGEPVEIVEQTARAAKDMDYNNHQVFILNDGFVAHKDNWKEIEEMAEQLGIKCFTRTLRGGAKAGNINNALQRTNAPLVAIFDADHVPHKDFLKKTVGYFCDPLMGFVQTPQYYKNYDANLTTEGAWDQQELFYGPICRGKNRLNSVTMCGTNMVISREALAEVGGMCTESIAEDFATGLFIHARGWKSTYVSEVLAEGLAPADFFSYYKQQSRWARGALDIIFKYNVFKMKGITFAQRIQYLSSVSFFFSGLVVALNMLLPIVFLYTGLIPLQISSMLLAAVFLPYIFLILFILSSTSGYRFSFTSLSFANSGFFIHIQAFFEAIAQRKNSFFITPKDSIKGDFLHLVMPQLIYISILIIGIPVALMREGLTPSLINNVAWASVNIGIFIPYMFAAAPALGWKLFMKDRRRAPRIKIPVSSV